MLWIRKTEYWKIVVINKFISKSKRNSVIKRNHLYHLYPTHTAIKFDISVFITKMSNDPNCIHAISVIYDWYSHSNIYSIHIHTYLSVCSIKFIVSNTSHCCLAKQVPRDEKSYGFAVYVEIWQRQHHRVLPLVHRSHILIIKSF